MKIFISAFLFLFSYNVQAATESARLGFTLSQMRQMRQTDLVNYLRVVQNTLSEFELEARKGIAQNQLRWPAMISEAEAADTVACINNGFIAEVKKCSVPYWSKITLNEQPLKELGEYNIVNRCHAPEQPCALPFGYRVRKTATKVVRELLCSPDRTTICRSESAKYGGPQAIAEDLKACAELKSGDRKGCNRLEEHLQTQITNLDLFCSKPPVPNVTKACKSGQQAVDKIREAANQYLPKPETTAPPTSGKSDILFFGDSYALGCFGKKFEERLRSFTPKGSAAAARVTSLMYAEASAPNLNEGTGAPALDDVRFVGPEGCKARNNCVRSMSTSPPSVEELLVKGAPTAVILQLGANDLVWDRPLDASTIDLKMMPVERLLNKVPPHSKCIFIGPPRILPTAQLGDTPYKMTDDDFDLFAKGLRSEVEKHGCQYVSSHDKMNLADRDSNGLRYTCKGENEWAENVWKEVKPTLERQLEQKPQISAKPGSAQ